MAPSADQSSGAEATSATLQGVIETVTYHNEDSLYSVLRVSPEAGFAVPASGLFTADRVTAVGRAPDPVEGMRVRLCGKWVEHRTHGVQFEFETLTALQPLDEEGLVRYFASKTFEGIGETLARRIVKALGTGALETIRDHPTSLNAVKGLSASVAKKFAASVCKQMSAHQAHAFLRGLGLGPLRAQAVVTKLGVDCEPVVRENPYVLAEVPGLGFPSADKIALELGFVEDDPRRLAAGVRHTLRIASEDGHTLLSIGDLCVRAEELLRRAAPRPALLDALDSLEQTRELVIDRALHGPAGKSDEDAERFAEELPVYLPWLFASEANLAQNIRHLRAEKAPPWADEAALSVAEKSAGIVLHSSQREAVLAMLSNPVGLITGGPGVGKTTIVRTVAALAEAAGAKVLLASPTGRAAKRLAEATGRHASTIHRLLGYNPGTEGFDHNADKPLDAGLVIVDEISMLDVVLAHHLVKAIKPPTRLVLVGDPNQLPSVGPGNVLADLLASEVVPTARLTHVFRQEARSLIVANAHRILSGEMPELPERGDKDSDFYFFGADDPVATADRLVDVVTKRIPETFGFNWETDVQVIAPMYRGPCGVDALNDRLRDALGYGGREVTQGASRWRTGDRVIHTRNDYEKEVFNGDMGRITRVTAEGLVTVKYPEQDVVYQGGELSDLRPAFAITVHRSQGGEFPVIVMPLVTQHYMMLQRNLLYTGITRARKLVVLVGMRKALAMAVENAEQRLRESALAERLRAASAED